MLEGGGTGSCLTAAAFTVLDSVFPDGPASGWDSFLSVGGLAATGADFVFSGFDAGALGKAIGLAVGLLAPIFVALATFSLSILPDVDLGFGAALAGLIAAFAFAAGAFVAATLATADLEVLGEAAAAVFLEETAGLAAAGLALESSFLGPALGLPLLAFVGLAFGFPPFPALAIVFLTGILAAVLFFFEAFTGSS